MGKKNSKMTEEERAMHDRAVSIRKMTDKQLCDFIDHTFGQGMEEGTRIAGGKMPDLPSPDESVRKFIDYLEARVGSGNRIGRGTILYLTRELDNAIAEGIL